MKHLVLFLLSFPVMAETIDCPPEIKSEQKILTAPKGWKQEEERFNSRQMLRSVSIYEGPVDEGAVLAPTEQLDKKNVWVLDNKRTHFVACSYGATYMMLVKDLKKAERCEIEYKDTAGLPKSINCR